MTDLTFNRSGEFGVTHVEADTEEGADFLDAWYPTDDSEFTVVDRGRIIVPDASVPALEREAASKGLKYEKGVVI